MGLPVLPIAKRRPRHQLADLSAAVPQASWVVMTLTILDGSTFCICADDGAISEGAHGFYADDTRFLSRLAVRINGERPMPLSAGKVEYFAAAFFLRNPLAGGLRADELLIRSERFVTDDLQEHIVVTNLAGDAVTVELAVELASDFADILSIKHHDFALGDPALAAALPAPVALIAGADAAGRAPARSRPASSSTDVRSSRAARVSGSALVLHARARPARRVGRAAHVPAAARAARDPAARPALATSASSATRIQRSLRGLEHARAAAARLVARPRAGLRALGLGSRRAAHARQRRRRPAAGGRHALVHDRVRPRHGHHVPADADLRPRAGAHRAARAGRAAGRARRSEHRRRAGQDHPRAAPRARGRGLVPALLRHRRCHAAVSRAALGDLALDGRRRARARARARDAQGAALDRRVRRPRRRRLRRVPAALGSRPRRAVVEGLARLAALRRRPHRRGADRGRARCRATSTTPSAAAPSSRARCSATRRSPSGWSATPRELRERFDRAFWVERNGGFYALALDGGKRPVDSRCSNMGHLLWSGIVPDARVAAVARTLLAPPLWSGWGVRTMSAEDEAYRPLAYHNGTVWPHDNSLMRPRPLAARRDRGVAAGSCAACSRPRASSTADCPRSSPGCARRETPFPVAYPTASRPQAWAAGAPVLLLRVLLGPRARSARAHAGRALGAPARMGRKPDAERACRRSGRASTCSSARAAPRSSTRSRIRPRRFGDRQARPHLAATGASDG